MTELPDRRMVDCLAYVKGLIMKDIISSIITSVLTALYQPFWFSVIPVCDGTVFLSLCLSIMRQVVRGIRGAFYRCGWHVFQRIAFFRSRFYLTFITTMILFRTLLNLGYVDESPFGCDGELVDLEIWRGWYQISHN